MLICWEPFEKPARQTSEAFLVVAVMLMVMVVVTDVFLAARASYLRRQLR